MAGLETSGNGRARVAAGVHDVPAVVVLGLVEKCLDTRLCEAPCTSVERLFLAPDNLLCVGVRVEVLLKLLPWEGVELLNTSDGNVLEAAGFTLLNERSVHLTCAENDTVDLLVRADGTSLMGRVTNNPFEVRLASELFDVRAGKRVAEKGLGEEHDERLAELAVHLTTKDVEDVRRLGQVSNLDVAVLVLAIELLGGWEHARVLVDELEVTLHTSGRVLRTLSIVTVGQAKHKTRSLQPLHLTRCDELIDDDLCGVGKITELGFPHDKRVRRRQ